jgi:hypothetical protein
VGIASTARDIGMSELVGKVCLGIYSVGFAVAPLILAPFSEELGVSHLGS